MVRAVVCFILIASSSSIVGASDSKQHCGRLVRTLKYSARWIPAAIFFSNPFWLPQILERHQAHVAQKIALKQKQDYSLAISKSMGGLDQSIAMRKAKLNDVRISSAEKNLVEDEIKIFEAVRVSLLSPEQPLTITTNQSYSVVPALFEAIWSVEANKTSQFQVQWPKEIFMTGSLDEWLAVFDRAASQYIKLTQTGGTNQVVINFTTQKPEHARGFVITIDAISEASRGLNMSRNWDKPGPVSVPLFKTLLFCFESLVLAIPEGSVVSYSQLTNANVKSVQPLTAGQEVLKELIIPKLSIPGLSDRARYENFKMLRASLEAYEARMPRATP